MLKANYIVLMLMLLIGNTVCYAESSVIRSVRSSIFGPKELNRINTVLGLEVGKPLNRRRLDDGRVIHFLVGMICPCGCRTLQRKCYVAAQNNVPSPGVILPTRGNTAGEDFPCVQAGMFANLTVLI